jgi:hypothetical protein
MTSSEGFILKCLCDTLMSFSMLFSKHSLGIFEGNVLLERRLHSVGARSKEVIRYAFNFEFSHLDVTVSCC